MKRTNLLRKSINLALSILVAGSIVAVGTDGTTLASIFGNNDAIITSVVDAAEVAQIPWSTAYVYGLLPIDLSTGGQGGASDGSTVTMDYTAGANRDWTARFTTAVTADNQVLQFQYLEPKGVLGYGGPATGAYCFMDATDTHRLNVFKYTLQKRNHLWEYTQPEFIAEMTSGNDTNISTSWYDLADESLYYRATCNFNSLAADGITHTQGMATFVEVKATGEVYCFTYAEPTATYNDILAKEIIYSCVPTKLQ